MQGPGLDASLLMQLSDPVLIVGSDGTIRFANTAFQTLSGWRTALTGHPVRDVIKEWDGTPVARGTYRTVGTSVERQGGPPLAVELVLSSWPAGGESVTGAMVRRAGGGDSPGPGAALHTAATRTAAEQAAAAAYRLLEEVIEMMPQAICVFDTEDRYVLWNHRYADLYPEIAGHLRVGMTFADILRISYASGRMSERASDFEEWLSQRLAKHARPSWREEQEFADGRWILHDGRRLPSGGAVGMRIDITDIKRREASFRLLFASNPVAMLVFEAGTLRILDVNDAACALYGRTRAEFLSAAISDLHVEAEREAAGTLYGRLVEAYEGRTVWHHLTRDAVVSVLIFIRASTHQDLSSYLAAVVDVSDRVHAEARIAHIAHHDPVTGLPNRIRFREVAQAALCQDRGRGSRRLVIHCLDLDGFKAVNDTYGHGVGDMLLAMVGERLLAAVRDDDFVARLGGDEFVVVQTSGLRNTEAVAERLVTCLGEVFPIQSHAISIGASLGFAVAPRDGTDLDQLIAAADAALYTAKAAGRGTWRAAVRPGGIAAAGGGATVEAAVRGVPAASRHPN